MTKRSSLAPSFLVAMPQLADPNFHRTVVMLVENNPEGSFGLVLNRPAELEAMEVCASLEISWQSAGGFEVRYGGPVHRNSGWVLLRQPTADPASEVLEITEGLAFTNSIDVLRAAVTESPDSLRLFLGYAGWAPGQLEAELAQGAWLLAPVSPDAIFEVADEQLWEHVLRKLGINPTTLIAVPGVH